MQIKLFGKK